MNLEVRLDTLYGGALLGYWHSSSLWALLWGVFYQYTRMHTEADYV